MTSNDTSPWITIRCYDTAHQAHFDKGALTARGVPAAVHGEHHGSIEWSPAEVSGIVLQVPKDWVERAGVVLGES